MFNVTEVRILHPVSNWAVGMIPVTVECHAEAVHLSTYTPP